MINCNFIRSIILFKFKKENCILNKPIDRLRDSTKTSTSVLNAVLQVAPFIVISLCICLCSQLNMFYGLFRFTTNIGRESNPFVMTRIYRGGQENTETYFVEAILKYRIYHIHNTCYSWQVLYKQVSLLHYYSKYLHTKSV